MWLILLLAVALLAQDSPVTATQWVRSGKQREMLRKINGRWWSQDNREVYPPSKSGMLGMWTLDSKPGVCVFYHHRPFELARAESLHLFQTLASVEAALGPPNRTFPMGHQGSARWYYYAADGTKLNIWFMDGEIGVAEYEGPGGKRPVASVASELGGRSIFHLRAERAGQKVRTTSSSAAPPRPVRTANGSRRGARPSMTVVETLPASEVAAADTRVVPSEAFHSVKPGDSRTEVIGRLGEPSQRFTISDGSDDRETLTYHLKGGRRATIRLVNGKVAQP